MSAATSSSVSSGKAVITSSERDVLELRVLGGEHERAERKHADELVVFVEHVNVADRRVIFIEARAVLRWFGRRYRRRRIATYCVVIRPPAVSSL